MCLFFLGVPCSSIKGIRFEKTHIFFSFFFLFFSSFFFFLFFSFFFLFLFKTTTIQTTTTTAEDAQLRLVGIPPMSRARPKVTWLYGYTCEGVKQTRTEIRHDFCCPWCTSYNGDLAGYALFFVELCFCGSPLYSTLRVTNI